MSTPSERRARLVAFWRKTPGTEGCATDDFDFIINSFFPQLGYRSDLLNDWINGKGDHCCIEALLDKEGC